LTAAPRTKRKTESDTKEVRAPPRYVTHKELSEIFGFESIEAYREHNRLLNEERMRIADQKLERAAAKARCFAV
jgi:TRAP-type uncharacterized transport system substrate-binding protein